MPKWRVEREEVTMRVIVANLLILVAVVALLFAGLMFVGLLVAKADAGQNADVMSFVRVIAPSLLVSVACCGGAIGVMVWGVK